MMMIQTATPMACTAALRAYLDSSSAACTARRLTESVANAASAACDSLLHAESLIQLGLLPKPCSHVLRVPHVRQSYNWDCGLACVLMVLKAAGVHTEDLASLRAACCTTSIWTVDLAYLLRRSGLSVELMTITLGANPDYASEGFYKEHIQEDGSRVERLFRDASAAGIKVTRKSMGCRELKDRMLLGSTLVIALVDKTRLAGHAGVAAGHKAVSLGMSVRMMIAPGYTGHYIVVCGYDSETDRFMIQDPASSAQLDSVPTSSLEAARHAYGTDEDLLLVTVPPSLVFGHPLVSI